MDAAYELIWEYSYGAVTIEAICEKAGVKKGSFYYFFDSKSDLAMAALNVWWEERKALAMEIFAPEVPPLERICRYLDYAAEKQLEAYKETGQILGCPIFTLGSEICAQDERILGLVHEILSTGARLFETAVRDAQALGQIEGKDAALKGRLLWAFYEGTLTRARIDNNPDLLYNLSADAMSMIGARTPLAAIA